MAEVGASPVPDDWHPPVIESLLLSIAAWWRLTNGPTIAIDLIGRNFQQDDITSAMFMIRNFHCYTELVGKIERRKQGKGRSAIYAQAEDLVKLLGRMDNADKLPRFVLHCEDLNRATSLMGGLGVREERAVSALLESLELGMRKVMDAVQQQGAAAAGRASSFQSVPKVVVTAPAGGAGAGQAGAAAPAGARRQVQGDRRTSQSVPRDISPSQKRPRMEEEEARPREEESPWVTVARKPRKTAVGKSNVDLAAMGLAAEAGPVEIYISNTANTSDEESIKKVLETTASKIEDTEGFTVIKAELLTKDINPRTKCWKVSVPYKFRELMENDELYPAGWRYRKFFASRNFRKLPEGGRRQGSQQAVTGGARGQGQEARGQRQEARGPGQEARGQEQEARGLGKEARGQGHEAMRQEAGAGGQGAVAGGQEARGKGLEAREEDVEVQVLSQDVTAALKAARDQVAQLEAQAASLPPAAGSEGEVTAQ